MSWVRLPPTSYFRFSPGKKEKGDDIFASVRAGDVNCYDSLLLSTTVVRGEGIAPEIPVTKLVRVIDGHQETHIFLLVIYTALPTEPRSHVTT